MTDGVDDVDADDDDGKDINDDPCNVADEAAESLLLLLSLFDSVVAAAVAQRYGCC